MCHLLWLWSALVLSSILLNNKEFCFTLIGLNTNFWVVPQSEYISSGSFGVYSWFAFDQPKPSVYYYLYFNELRFSRLVLYTASDFISHPRRSTQNSMPKSVADDCWRMWVKSLFRNGIILGDGVRVRTFSNEDFY